MLYERSFSVRRYLHGDLSDDGSGSAFCARCGGFHLPSHFDDRLHETIQSAKFVQSVGSWMHNAARSGRGAGRASNAANLFSPSVAAIAEALGVPKWVK